MSNPPTTSGPMYQAIHSKLTELLKPATLEIQNDSWQHRDHSAMRERGGGNGETPKSDFTVQIISSAFTGKRHRMIYGALSEEFAQGLHALSLQTKTPDEVAEASAVES
ncbi:hypothetical protein FRC10_008133 [Ceratobasidium sp. 414]|nr:hypothetical protein FRC10_008133 [Ceratobasidium sp. 414]